MNLTKYESWGRYPKISPKQVLQLKWRNEIPDLNCVEGTLLPFGYGKSYGDVCLNENGTLLDTKGLNKLIAFDENTGVLRCESGVTLASILEYATPRGWFLTVTPGTKHVSVGGCIANDVHGKNHHVDGTFGCHVRKFELVRSDRERIICSPDDNPELFRATIGGLGLTGLITWAEFQLMKSPTPFFYTESIKFDNLDRFFEINEESEQEFRYSVSWIDTTATDGNLGRGLFNRGNQADPSVHAIPPLPGEMMLPFPFDAPFINTATVQAFNILYYHKQLDRVVRGVSHYNPFFYPLDAILGWNKAYGKNGFLQYQFVMPFSSREALKDILKFISASGLSSFLTVLKTMGSVRSPGMLSFPRPGITMAVDFRISPKTLAVVNDLDRIVTAAGGVLYPAKDARMAGSDFRKFYPMWEEFSSYIDPKFSSSFWRRVTGE